MTETVLVDNTFFARLWVSPKQYPDFGFVWLSRCFIFLGYALFITFLSLYLQNVIHFQRPDQGVTIFQVIATGVLILGAIGGGLFADKMQRLKPFVSLAAITMMVSFLSRMSDNTR